jgi:hypothetical protein
VNVATILEGSWTARWGNWVVGLKTHNDKWQVTVWRWPPDTVLNERVQINKWSGAETTDEAVTWACDQMIADGAKVFVLGAPKNFALKRVLSFVKAPQPVG